MLKNKSEAGIAHLSRYTFSIPTYILLIVMNPQTKVCLKIVTR